MDPPQVPVKVPPKTTDSKPGSKEFEKANFDHP
jgi:hypothetical protein